MQKKWNNFFKIYYDLTYKYYFEILYYAFSDCLNNWRTEINSTENKESKKEKIIIWISGYINIPKNGVDFHVYSIQIIS